MEERDRVMLSMKDLVFKERLVKKLIEQYIESYAIEKMVSKNTVKLKLLAFMRIHSVVNISRIVRYRDPVKEQRVEEPKPVEVDGVKEWKVEKILNKRKVRGIIKYLVHWKMFTAKNDIWKKEEDLKNAKDLVNKFEERMNAEVR